MAKVGRPTKYNAAILEKANEYLTDYKNQEFGNMIPSVDGLSLYLKVNRSTIYEWGSKYTEFSNTLDEINTKQKILLIDGGLSNEFNSNITKLALGNHGMSDKIQATVTEISHEEWLDGLDG